MLSIRQMPDNARVWVFQSNKNFSDTELIAIQKSGLDFIENWSAHGASLKASFDIVYDRFIVIAVDEEQAAASGCSIDKAIHFVKELEKQFDLALFDRMQVAYRKENGIAACSLSEFEKLAALGEVNGSTTVFNNMVTTKKEFDTNWEINLKQSWQSRVLHNLNKQ